MKADIKLGGALNAMTIAVRCLVLLHQMVLLSRVAFRLALGSSASKESPAFSYWKYFDILRCQTPNVLLLALETVYAQEGVETIYGDWCPINS